ncbi:protein kinase [Saccharomycopsis crataegensis]|uniref:Protein kinase n=1 Tax=Saccharomycopsis crataegensis TaxID=43959 RepID=A0AAV5QNZ5_9ASCO|nr:protein kinase [Saccharomycopsis crataegensis]
MSLVVYNDDRSELKVVLHDPQRDAMIIHDTNSNKFQLIKTTHDHSDGYGNNKNLHSQSSNDIQCPNCGHAIRNPGAPSPSTTSSSAPPTKSLTQQQSSFDRRGSDVFNNRFNRDFKYINNNYFKLLAISSNAHEGVEDIQEPQLLDMNQAPPQPKIFSLDNSSQTSNTKGMVASSKLYEELPKNLFTHDYFRKFFKIDKLLGRGSNASVYKVEHFINDFSLGFFAVKKIAIGNDTKGLLRILKEVELLCLLSTSNKNLVKYNHVWLEISQASDFGPKVPCAFILTEYCDGGNLEELVNNLSHPKADIEAQKQRIRELRKQKKRGTGFHQEKGLTSPKFLSLIEVLKFFKDIVTGVHELHSNHIIHRDLKPSNCLISNRHEDLPSEFDQAEFINEEKYKKFLSLPRILVSDFGESQFEGKLRNSTGATGTLEFVAPELLLPKSPTSTSLNEFSKSTDMFGLGMILFFMCFGDLPYQTTFSDLDYSSLKNQIKNFDIIEFFNSSNFYGKYQREDLSSEIYNIMKNLLSRNPIERLSTSELLKLLHQLIAKELYSGRFVPMEGSLVSSLDDNYSSSTHTNGNNDKSYKSENENYLAIAETKTDIIVPIKVPGQKDRSLFNIVISRVENDWRFYIIAKLLVVSIEIKLISYFVEKYYSNNYEDLGDDFNKFSRIFDGGILSSFMRREKYLLLNLLVLGMTISTSSISNSLFVIALSAFIDQALFLMK